MKKTWSQPWCVVMELERRGMAELPVPVRLGRCAPGWAFGRDGRGFWGLPWDVPCGLPWVLPWVFPRREPDERSPRPLWPACPPDSFATGARLPDPLSTGARPPESLAGAAWGPKGDSACAPPSRGGVELVPASRGRVEREPSDSTRCCSRASSPVRPPRRLLRPMLHLPARPRAPDRSPCSYGRDSSKTNGDERPSPKEGLSHGGRTRR